MNASVFGRLAVVGLLLTVLVCAFVLSGAGWVLSDPQQRATGETATVTGTVVGTDPVTVDLGDGDTIVTGDVDPTAVTHGDTVAVDVTIRNPGSRPDVIEATTLQQWFMYLGSALAGLFVLGRVLDTWRVDIRHLRIEPRTRPLHRTGLAKLRGRPDRGQTREGPPRGATDRSGESDG